MVLSPVREEEIEETQSIPGPGRLLREERERRGLTLDEISLATKLRPYILKTLEEEQWDSLPSPAFVRGFLRTYAKFLSMDEDKILGAYGTNISVDPDLRNLEGEPFPGKGKRSSLFLWMLAAVVALFVLWKMYAPLDRTLTVQREQSASVTTDGEKTQAAQITAPPASQEEIGPSAASSQIPENAEAAHPAVPEVSAHKPAEGPVVLETVQKSGPHTLRGKVGARTWVKIYIDDLEPREYMFQPGQQPEWTASKGFYVIIGNAGGIALEWNGEAVGNTGAAGQVVRIRLPKDFRYRVEGN